MADRPFVILDEGRATEVPARIEGDEVWLDPPALEAALGWRLEERGLCRGETCVPVPPGDALLRDGSIGLAALADRLERPLALDPAERVACLGVPARERARALESLDAPDFTLPDLDGKPHTLSDYRGKKVMLIAYASW